ncbi:MAG: hypothetical protein EOP38_16920 [Rubrivivax sp.]|nr:MAG: hypothetical protein EOP38_16920 [Rubrivivax sp.]
MTPTVPVPTDNIFKFACMFGLALIVSCIFAFVSTYTAALDRKVKYSEALIPLEAKTQRTKAEDDMLVMNKKLIEVTKSNEKFSNGAIALVFAFGSLLSWYGASKWHSVIQRRDDRLVELQLEKLEAEIAKLRTEAGKA